MRAGSPIRPPLLPGFALALALPWAAGGETLAEEVARRVEDHRARWGTPGVAVAVVEAGRVAHLGGYGLADVEASRGVDPETTVFPLFSVSKTFTAVLALQEVEAGRLALDRDLREMLPAGLVPGAPLTLHSLLTHSSGLDERLLGMTEVPGREPPELSAFLARWLPPRVRPAGEVIQYSIGYGTSLAGLAVERSSGASFPALVAGRILAPLKMESSAPGRRDWMEGREAAGYLPRGRGRPPRRVPRATLRVGPAGGIHATASDMARYMAALLPPSLPDSPRILSTASLALMTSPRQSPHPAFPGVGYGLFLRPGGGEHAGGPLPHLSCMTLLPGAGAGIFFATNSPTGIFLILELSDALARGRYGVAPPPDPPPAGAPAEALVGTWRSTWVDRTGPFAVNVLSPAVPEIEITLDRGQLVAVHPTSGLREQWIPEQSGLYRRPGGRGPVAFVRGEGGRPDRLFLHPLLPVAHFVVTFDRVAPWATRRVLAPLEGLLLACLATLTLGLAWLRHRLGRAPPPAGSPLAALASLFLLAGHGVPLAALSACLGKAGLGGLAELAAPARALGVLGLAGAGLVPAFWYREVRRPGAPFPRRLLELALLVAGMASLAAWGLLDRVP